MKVLCPKCGQVFKPSFGSMPEDAWITGEEFKCENCGVRLKQFPLGASHRRFVGANENVNLASMGKVIACSVILFIMPLCIWGKTGISGFGYFALAVVIIGFIVGIVAAWRFGNKDPLVAELYEEGT